MKSLLALGAALSLAFLGWLILGQQPLAVQDGPERSADQGVSRGTVSTTDTPAIAPSTPSETDALRTGAGAPETVATPTEVEPTAEPEALPALEGQVVTADGVPVAGAEVRVWRGSRARDEPAIVSTASGTGHFSVTGFGPEFVAAAFHPDLVCQKGLRGKISDTTKCVGLQLILAPAYDLAGTVVRPDGSPVEGAVLELSDDLNSSSSRDGTDTPGIRTFGSIAGAVAERQVTESNGRFRFLGVGGATVAVRVEAPGLVGDWFYHSPESGEARFTLDTGASLSGVVLDSDGDPAVGATIRFGPFSSNLGVSRSTTKTDTEGRFRITGLSRSDDPQETPYFVAALYKGHAPTLIQPAAIEGKGPDNVLRLERAAPLSGRVLHPDGTPAPGVEIRLETERLFERSYVKVGHPPTWESLFSPFKGFADEDGAFTFANRVDGPCTLRITAPNFPSGRDLKFPVAKGQAEVEIVLDPLAIQGVVLRGRLVDADTGNPIPSFTLRPWPARDKSGSMSASNYEIDEDPEAPGTFDLAGLNAESIQLECIAEGYASVRLPRREFEVGVHELGDIALTPSAALRIEVVDEQGERLREGTLSVQDAEGQQLRLRFGPMTTNQVQLRGEPVLLEDIPTGNLTVIVETGGERWVEPGVYPKSYVGSALTITVKRPELGVLMVAILDGASLGADSDSFMKALRKAVAAEDMDWFRANGERFTSAFPKYAYEVELTRDATRLATGSVKWNADSGLYDVSTSRGRTGSSAEGIPSPDLHWPDLPLGPVELTVRAEGRKAATTTVEVVRIEDAGRAPTFVLL